MQARLQLKHIDPNNNYKQKLVNQNHYLTAHSTFLLPQKRYP